MKRKFKDLAISKCTKLNLALSNLKTREKSEEGITDLVVILFLIALGILAVSAFANPFLEAINAQSSAINQCVAGASFNSLLGCN